MSDRLPETELANWAFLSPSQKRANLEKHEQPKSIVGSYEPFRKVFPDAINQQFPLFGAALEASRWEAVEARLIAECGGNENLIRMNRGVLKATHKHCADNRVSALPIDALPLTFGGGIKYQIGMNLLMRSHESAALIFCDLRRSNRLTERGMKFIYSAIHHRFREAYPDYSNASIEIWRYGTTTERSLKAVSVFGDPIGWDEICSDVEETHRIWDEVRKGGSDKKRASGGGAGPLFD